MTGVWSLQKGYERAADADATLGPTMRTSIATSVSGAVFPSLIHLRAIKLLLPQPGVDIVVPLA